MKKLISILLMVIMTVSMVGCGSDPQHTVSYVEGKVMELPLMMILLTVYVYSQNIRTIVVQRQFRQTK